MTSKKALQSKIKNQSSFLAAFRHCGRVDKAAEAAGITRQAHYLWLKDPEYVFRYEEAQTEAVQLLEDEAIRRAVQGVEEPVYHGGKIVGSKLSYSDTLLIFLLKGAKPEKYRDRFDLSAKVHRVARPPDPIVSTFKEVFTVEELKRIKARMVEQEEEKRLKAAKQVKVESASQDQPLLPSGDSPRSPN